MRRFIFPLKVLAWETISTDTGVPLRPGSEMKAVGFIPVYESIQAMAEDHGSKCRSGTFEENVTKEMA